MSDELKYARIQWQQAGYNENHRFGAINEAAHELLREVWPIHEARKLDRDSILILFRRDGKRSHGREQMGHTKRIPDTTRDLLLFCGATSCPRFLIILSWPWWLQANDAERMALLDHELTHCGSDGEIRHHELEEFAEVIERRGIWSEDIRSFVARTRGQLRLPIPESTDGGPDITSRESEAADPAKKIPPEAMKILRKMDRDLKRQGLTATFEAGGRKASIGVRQTGDESSTDHPPSPS
jgi:hypothetical protein